MFVTVGMARAFGGRMAYTPMRASHKILSVYYVFKRTGIQGVAADCLYQALAVKILFALANRISERRWIWDRHPGRRSSSIRSRGDRGPAILQRCCGECPTFLGSAERRATAAPGMLAQRTAPTEPCAITYEPSIFVAARGEKRVELGRNIFTYGVSRVLLTSVDMHVVARVVNASAATGKRRDAVPDLVAQSRKCLWFESCLAGRRSRWQRRRLTALPWQPVRPLRIPQRMLPPCGFARNSPGYSVSQRSNRKSSTGFCRFRGRTSRQPSQPWMRVASGRQKPLGTSQRTIPGRYEWNLWRKSRPWAYPRCIIYFRMLTAMSPLRHQKLLRLQASRSRMLAEGAGVSRTAFDVGYEGVSQFSREYSAFVGQPPLRDLKALRSSDAASIESVSSRPNAI